MVTSRYLIDDGYHPADIGLNRKMSAGNTMTNAILSAEIPDEASAEFQTALNTLLGLFGSGYMS